MISSWHASRVVTETLKAELWDFWYFDIEPPAKYQETENVSWPLHCSFEFPKDRGTIQSIKTSVSSKVPVAIYYIFMGNYQSFIAEEACVFKKLISRSSINAIFVHDQDMCWHEWHWKRGTIKKGSGNLIFQMGSEPMSVHKGDQLKIRKRPGTMQANTTVFDQKYERHPAKQETLKFRCP